MSKTPSKDVEPTVGPAPTCDVSNDVAAEDWGMLFDAVLERLKSCLPSRSIDCASDRLAWSQARITVLECVEALDQLHKKAEHERSPLGHTETDAKVLSFGAPLARADVVSPTVKVDLVHAIQWAWYHNMCALFCFFPRGR